MYYILYMAAKPMHWPFIVRTSNVFVIVQTQHRLTLANGVTMAINSSECCQLDLIHLARMSSAEVTHYQSLSGISHKLHFRNISDSSKLSVMRDLCGLISRPLWENTLSTGAELAGEHKTYSNRLLSKLKSIFSNRSGILFSTQLKVDELMVSR